MNPRHRMHGRTSRMIFPVILRITVSLLLWTFGAAPMRVAAAKNTEHRVVYNFAIDRAKLQDLQRWVNAGHDPWCRDAQLVATESLRRIAADSDIELTAVPLELERSRKTVAVYTFHSLDGRTTYRITVRRYRWLLPVAGSMHRVIWVPESAEIVTQPGEPATQSSMRSAVV